MVRTTRCPDAEGTVAAFDLRAMTEAFKAISNTALLLLHNSAPLAAPRANGEAEQVVGAIRDIVFTRQSNPQYSARPGLPLWWLF